MPEKFKVLAKNVGLAALAAFVSTFLTAYQLLPDEDKFSKAAVFAAVTAAAYAAVRAAVGVVKEGLGGPFEVDTPLPRDDEAA